MNDEYISPLETARLLGYEDTNIIYELYRYGDLRGYQRKQRAKAFIEKKSVIKYRQRLINDVG